MRLRTGKAYTKIMLDCEFIRGKATPCIFQNNDRDLQAVIHGDDFAILGTPADLDWFRDSIQTRFEVKCEAAWDQILTTAKAFAY